MTVEDKLTHDERLRLECVAQAVQLSAIHVARRGGASPVLEMAADLEKFVREGALSSDAAKSEGDSAASVGGLRHPPSAGLYPRR